LSKENFIDYVEEHGTRYIDNENKGNINIYAPRPDEKSGKLRITVSNDGLRLISSGIERENKINNGLKSGRLIEQK
jgi:hypothetical protein